MDGKNVANLYAEFQSGFNDDEKLRIWDQYQKLFRSFWYDRVLRQSPGELLDEEIDEVVRILDVNGKGRKRGEDAVAKVMIPQGAWRRMFNGLHSDKNLRTLLTSVFEEKAPEKRAQNIDKLYESNSGNRNSLTGGSGNAVNTLLAAFDPFENLCVVSLKDRFSLLAKIDQNAVSELAARSIGEKIVASNTAIFNAFAQVGVSGSARKISEFCYYPAFRALWRRPEENPPDPEPEDVKAFGDEYLFYMEKQLEDFIVGNWDRIEFCRGLELLEEDGSLVSQQFPTGIGKIDILAKEKASGKYVVIELKKNQTSDDTIGQLTRYMGWVEEHKTKGKATKGIIIAAKPDERLRYAMKKVPDTELYLYKVDFKLEKAN
jgi:hypothetical protein